MEFIDLKHSFLLSDDEYITFPDIEKPALFLDRDGVLIEDKNYLSDPFDVELIKGASELISACRQIGIPTVIVTNQSGIDRGLFDWKDYKIVTAHI